MVSLYLFLTFAYVRIEHKFGTLIEQIVLSPQFRNRRAPQATVAPVPAQPVKQVARN